MADFWSAAAGAGPDKSAAEWPPTATDRSVRKEQITIRLDAGMIADARTIGARKGIGHHTLMRMWVMEGIIRAYEDGLLDHPPQSWTLSEERLPAAPRSGDDGTSATVPPSGARWTRNGRRR